MLLPEFLRMCISVYVYEEDHAQDSDLIDETNNLNSFSIDFSSASQLRLVFFNASVTCHSSFASLYVAAKTNKSNTVQ